MMHRELVRKIILRMTYTCERRLGHQDPCFKIKIDKDFSWVVGYNIRFALGLHHKSSSGQLVGE